MFQPGPVFVFRKRPGHKKVASYWEKARFQSPALGTLLLRHWESLPSDKVF